MSNTDSFIDEVTEEVRRDQLYKMLRRYGWIAALVLLLIIGGVAWLEIRKAQARAQAEALGDAMLAALSVDDTADRAQALTGISAGSAEGAAVLAMMTAAEQAKADDIPAAIATLDQLSVDGDVPAIYRQVAQFKSLILQSGVTDADERRLSFDALAQPGNPLRLLASEQLALIDIETGDTEAALARYQDILGDAELTQDLQQRALQVIVALGGSPEAGTTGQDAGLSFGTDN
ncbi:hypothetical protein [Sulfitobacter sp. JB4-11]|uniref:hypothetical protein n=1 Tax=Sulfitobacter rhodophyticola TaxID=3238304 RepID=UPI0035143327